MAIFMKYGKGPDIKGGATAKGYTNWIKLSSIGLSISRPISIKVGGGAHSRHRSMPSISNVSCSHTLDASTLPLLNACLGTVKEAPVEIHCCKAGDKGVPEPYMIIKLTDVLCTSFGFSGEGGEPFDSFSLNWGTIDIEYKGADVKGNVKPARVSYDVTKASAG